MRENCNFSRIDLNQIKIGINFKVKNFLHSKVLIYPRKCRINQ